MNLRAWSVLLVIAPLGCQLAIEPGVDDLLGGPRAGERAAELASTEQVSASSWALLGCALRAEHDWLSCSAAGLEAMDGRALQGCYATWSEELLACPAGG